MHDFPPVVPDFEDTAAAPPPPSGRAAVAVPSTAARRSRGDFSYPDTRSPVRFLGWLVRQQRAAVALLALVTTVEWLPGAIGPYVVGRIIDDGITPENLAVVGWLSLVLLGLVLAGAAAGVLSHTLIVRTWLVGMYGSTKLVTRKVVQMGHVLPHRTPTGEVLSVASGDADQFGGLNEVLAN